VSLSWPPAPPDELAGQLVAGAEPPQANGGQHQVAAAPPPPPLASSSPADQRPRDWSHLAAEVVADPAAPSAGLVAGGLVAGGLVAGLSDPRLINGVGEISAMMATDLDDGATTAEVMPIIRDSARRWLEGQVRAGLLPASAGVDLDELARAVHDQRYGLGPLSAYLRDPQVENVDVNGCDQVWITYASGERVAGPPVAASDDALISMIRTWATRGGQTSRDFSAAAPLVNVALTGSARMTATMSVTPRPCVSLRRHGQIDITLGRLVQLGSIDAPVAAFLSAAVKGRCNIIVTGGVNAGKTTMLRALASEISPGERVATLESEYELYLHELAQHPDVIPFEAREPNSEGVGGISLHDLIAHALRHNPRRIIVGEVRRSEIMPMLEAMNSGQDGSMCTLHANSPTEAFDRILILGLRGGLALAERAIHILVGMAVDLIVHIRRGYDGSRTVRFVSEILEVMPPGDTERPAVNRLFLPDARTGRACSAHTPSPAMLARLAAAGFDASMLDQHQEQQHWPEQHWPAQQWPEQRAGQHRAGPIGNGATGTGQYLNGRQPGSRTR
jgi:Flp pilus assembly CpaF family ATPase